MKKKTKLQAPEKRMRVYDDSVPQDKQKWIDFRIVVPDKNTKKQLQAAFEYLHDNRLIDTGFMAVNAVVHAYLDEAREKGTESPILVDRQLFTEIKQQTCKHNREHYFYDNMEFCKDCHAVILER